MQSVTITGRIGQIERIMINNRKALKLRIAVYIDKDTTNWWSILIFGGRNDDFSRYDGWEPGDTVSASGELRTGNSSIWNGKEGPQVNLEIGYGLRISRVAFANKNGNNSGGDGWTEKKPQKESWGGSGNAPAPAPAKGGWGNDEPDDLWSSSGSEGWGP